MQIINQSHKFESELNSEYRNYALKLIEKAGRTCYKSEDKIKDESASLFIQSIMNKNHESVIEHVPITIRFITDRGVTHELCRHRLASFSQESTRYVASAKREKYILNSDESIINAYEVLGYTMKKISTISGKTEWEIYKILNQNDIQRRHHNSTGIINTTFFDTIDTPEKAYLLGLIQADGNLRTLSFGISITQHKDYAWYLHRMLKDFVSTSISIHNDRKCKQLKITSEQLWIALVNKGIVPNKTNEQTDNDIDVLWSSIQNDFKWDFIRGLFDGDGCIRFFQQKNPGKTLSSHLILLGHEHLLLLIREYMLLHFNEFKSKIRVHGGTYNLTISNPKAVQLFCSLMYKNCKFPYTHPKKASRISEAIGLSLPVVNWGDLEFKVIHPVYFDKLNETWWNFYESIDKAENEYIEMLQKGSTPQEARGILPNSIKTEIVVTANLREWRHILDLRCSAAAHPQMRALMLPVLKELNDWMPEIFNDIANKYK